MRSKDIKIGFQYRINRPVYLNGFKIRVAHEVRTCVRIDTTGKSPLFIMQDTQTGTERDVFAKDVLNQVVRS